MVSFKCTIALLAAGLFAGVDAVVCNRNDCYRALFPCPFPTAVDIAAQFCATITASGTTATNYPTRAISACGTTPEKYLSACECGPTCPTTTPLPSSDSTTTSAPTTTEDSTSISMSTEDSTSMSMSTDTTTSESSMTTDITTSTTSEPETTTTSTSASEVEETLTPTSSESMTTTSTMASISISSATPSGCTLPPILPGLLPNGDFECGLLGWTTESTGPDGIIQLRPDNPFSGSMSLGVLNLSPAESDTWFHARLTSDPLDLTVGSLYTLSFRLRSYWGRGFFVVRIAGAEPRLHLLPADVDQDFSYFEFTEEWIRASSDWNSQVKIDFYLTGPEYVNCDHIILTQG